MAAAPTSIDVLAAGMTEAELLANVRQLARLRGWLTYHTQRSQRSEPGFPDLMLVRRSRAVAVELKSQRGKCSPAQERWLEGLRGAGLEVYVWRPADWLAGSIDRALR